MSVRFCGHERMSPEEYVYEASQAVCLIRREEKERMVGGVTHGKDHDPSGVRGRRTPKDRGHPPHGAGGDADPQPESAYFVEEEGQYDASSSSTSTLRSHSSRSFPMASFHVTPAMNAAESRRLETLEEGTRQRSDRQIWSLTLVQRRTNDPSDLSHRDPSGLTKRRSAMRAASEELLEEEKATPVRVQLGLEACRREEPLGSL